LEAEYKKLKEIQGHFNISVEHHDGSCITHLHLQRNGFVQNHETNQPKLIWAETETGDIEEEKVNGMMCYRTKSRKHSLLEAMMRRRSTRSTCMEWVYEGEEGGDIDLTGYGEMFLQQVKLSIHPFLVSFWHSVAVTVKNCLIWQTKTWKRIPSIPFHCAIPLRLF
jgi:hypothetical protein